MSRAWRRRWLGIGVAALGLVAAGCGFQWPGDGFGNPPSRVPVTTALVSANGRVITAVGGKACQHDPQLLARSYPDKVTLVWVNPDTNCNAETVESAVVRITLPRPLGSRPLVNPAGGRIPYFSQREFARVTVLPGGYQLISEVPAISVPGQPAGDERTYAVPSGTETAGTHRPCPCAQLMISQLVMGKRFMPPTQQTSKHTIHVQVHGIAAALLVNGPFASVNWPEDGYYFTVGVAYGPHKASLANAQLIAIANGMQLRPGKLGDSWVTIYESSVTGHRFDSSRLSR